MLPTTEAEVLKLYPPHGRLKISQYLHEKRIWIEPASPGALCVRAQVAGNRPSPYRLSIPVEDARGLAGAACDCPAEGLCVHIGATWILHLRNRDRLAAGPLAERDAALASLRKSLEAGGAPEGPEAGEASQHPGGLHPAAGNADGADGPGIAATRFAPRENPLDWTEEPVPPPLEPRKGDPVLLEAIDRLFGALPDQGGSAGARRAGKSGETWALAFLLEAAGLPEQRGGEPQLLVRPVLAYRRQDGGLGRIKEFKPDQLGETPEALDRHWLDTALALGGAVPVEQLLLLAELPGAPALPAVRTAAGEAMRLFEAERLSLVFQPELERYGRQGLVYQARIELEAPPELGGHDGPIVMGAWQRGLRHQIFYNQEGLVAYRRVDPALAAVLDFLARQYRQLEGPAVERLVRRLEQEPLSGLSVAWRGRQVQRLMARGLPVLSVEAGVDGLWSRGRPTTLLRLEIDWELDEAPDAAGSPDATGAPGAAGAAHAAGALGAPPLAPRSADWTQCLRLEPAKPDQPAEPGAQATLWIRDLAWERQAIDWLWHCLGQAGFPLPEDHPGAGFAEPGSDEPPDWRRRPFADRFRALPQASPAAKLRMMDELRSASLPIDQATFLRRHAPALMDQGFALRLGRDEPPSRRGRVGIQVDRGLDWLDIQAFVDSFPPGSPGRRQRLARQARAKAIDANRREELAAVQDLLQVGIARTPTGLIRLEPGDADRLQRLLDAGLESGRPTRVAGNNLAQLAALHDSSTAHIREIATARELVDKLGRLDTLELLEPDPGFRATLRGYQRRGFSWLLHLQAAGLGACLADDMGLGKTVQALAAIQVLRRRHQAGQAGAAGLEAPQTFRALLVVPVSTLPNWQAEARRFCPELQVLRHEGPARAKADIESFRRGLDGRDLVLVSYATLRQDHELFAACAWPLMLVDEAHTIKNPESATFTAVRSIPAGFRVSLTGTPVENSVLDLWAQMEFINPGMLGSLKRFRARYGSAIEERRDDAALATLRRIISPFILRRKKEDVARDLPPKEEIVLYVDLEPAQRQVYEDIKEAYRLKIEDAVKQNGVSRSALTILEALLRLRQACLMPGIINPAWDQAGSAKLVAFAGLMQDLAAEDHKALVFSQFVEVLGRLRAELERLGLPACYLDGQTRARQAEVERFQTDPAVRAFLISLKAGGVGINLTAADYVILFDPWWNPAAEAQAIDRAHRIGQDRPVIVYRLIARDTVEEKILLLQEHKRELASTLTGGDEALVASLNPAELLELFG